MPSVRMIEASLISVTCDGKPVVLNVSSYGVADVEELISSLKCLSAVAMFKLYARADPVETEHPVEAVPGIYEVNITTPLIVIDEASIFSAEDKSIFHPAGLIVVGVVTAVVAVRSDSTMGIYASYCAWVRGLK